MKNSSKIEYRKRIFERWLLENKKFSQSRVDILVKKLQLAQAITILNADTMSELKQTENAILNSKEYKELQFFDKLTLSSVLKFYEAFFSKLDNNEVKLRTANEVSHNLRTLQAPVGLVESMRRRDQFIQWLLKYKLFSQSRVDSIMRRLELVQANVVFDAITKNGIRQIIDFIVKSKEYKQLNFFDRDLCDIGLKYYEKFFSLPAFRKANLVNEGLINEAAQLSTNDRNLIAEQTTFESVNANSSRLENLNINEILIESYFTILVEALENDGVILIEQLLNMNMVSYLNSKNLYSYGDRIRILDRLKSKLVPYRYLTKGSELSKGPEKVSAESSNNNIKGDSIGQREGRKTEFTKWLDYNKHFSQELISQIKQRLQNMQGDKFFDICTIDKVKIAKEATLNSENYEWLSYNAKKLCSDSFDFYKEFLTKTQISTEIITSGDTCDLPIEKGRVDEAIYTILGKRKQPISAFLEVVSSEDFPAHYDFNCNTPKVNECIRMVIMDILDRHFPNGIRLNSIIDSNKLRNYYTEATGSDMSEVVPDIPSMLINVGIKHGEKVYAISTSAKKEIAELLDRLLSEDNRLFYYDEFYDAHADFLQEMRIFSSELLRVLLSEIKPSLWYYKNYCLTDKNTTIESEILRCYKTAVCLSYDQLNYRLPYVPLSSIRQVLAQNSDFLWVNTSVYTHVSKIEFDKLKSYEICTIIEEAVTKHGFVSLASVDIRSIAEVNPELSMVAIRNGFFQVYLSDLYEKRGNIITAKGTVLNSVAVFEDFCRSRDRLTLDELLNYEKEINGDVHNQSLFVAYDNMVRADRETFIADSEIKFDIDATDNALALFFNGDVIPLRAVTSFTSFPYIDGYPWNWFLLESFCRRFSKRFRFQCLSVSSQNLGAIYKKSAGFADYVEILAAAVAVEPIKLDQKEVGDFLFESGYIARRTSFIAEVISKAHLLRERRG